MSEGAVMAWARRRLEADDHRRHAELHTGQISMAHHLAAAEAGRLMFVRGIGWHVWNDSVWEPDRDGAPNRAVQRVIADQIREAAGDKQRLREIARVESAAGIDGILRIASTLASIAVPIDDLDVDPYLLAIGNGTLDLRTLEIRQSNPADRMTKQARGSYLPGEARSANWLPFLGRVLPDVEVRDYLQRVVGVALLGVVKEHILPILTGTGANGKGTFDRAIGFALGGYAGTAEPDLLMPRAGAHPTGQMALRGLRWCVVSESNEDRRMDEAVMKRLTGGDEITARYMGKDFVTFKPSHTVALITNHLPKVRGDDVAVFRRARVIPFDVVIPEQERNVDLDELLEAEADAILTWAVEGYRAYLEKGMATPDKVMVATEEYRVENDAVSRWMDDACTIVPGNAALATELSVLHRSYSKWTQREAAEQLSSVALGKALDRLGFPSKKGTGGRRRRLGIAPIAEQYNHEEAQ